jgi:hypothetical protein
MNDFGLKHCIAVKKCKNNITRKQVSKETSNLLGVFGTLKSEDILPEATPHPKSGSG